MNISISVDPQLFDEGSSVNLTCSSVANPAADSYIWYKMVDSDATSSMLQVGSGQLLSLPSVEESHSGVYLCKVRNSLGESNSTQVLLSMQRKQNGRSHYLQMLVVSSKGNLCKIPQPLNLI